MKPFTQYLREMNKVYEFSIKLAGIDCDKDQQEKLKMALETYAVESMGSVKRLPIQEHLDFPGCGPLECHMVDVAVCYPVVTDQVAQLVAEKLGMPRKHVLVRTKGEEAIMSSVAEPKKAKDGSVLNNPDLDSEAGGQELVAQSRNDSMLKDLQSRKYEFAAKPEPVKQEKLTPNNVSPVGSRQNKIPSPVKGN